MSSKITFDTTETIRNGALCYSVVAHQEKPKFLNTALTTVGNVIAAPFKAIGRLFASPFIWVHNKMTDRAIAKTLNGTDTKKASALRKEMGKVHYTNQNHGIIFSVTSYVRPGQTYFKQSSLATVEERRAAYKQYLSSQSVKK